MTCLDEMLWEHLVIKNVILTTEKQNVFYPRSTVRVETVVSSTLYRLKVRIVTHDIWRCASMTHWSHWFRTSLQVLSQTKTNPEEYPAHDTFHMFSATQLAPHSPEH